MGIKSGEEQTGRTKPNSIRQRRILDVAGGHPQASMELIAEKVPSASIDLVERVLDEFGDPAVDTPTGHEETDSMERSRNGSTDDPRKEGGTTAGREHDPTDDQGADDGGAAGAPSTNGHRAGPEQDQIPITTLPDHQQEVLRAVAERPNAPQREIADCLGISRPTVSNRVNSIENFEWGNRKQDIEHFRTRVFADTTSRNGAMTTNEPDSPDGVDELRERVDTLEQQIAETETTGEQARALDSTLIHKVVHACYQSDSITEDEELELLRIFLPDDS